MRRWRSSRAACRILNPDELSRASVSASSSEGRKGSSPERGYHRTRMERIKAARGPTVRCQGWRQEAILRMLENNLENAEKPDDLIIYGGTGKAARNWDAFHRIVETLKSLSDDETLVV